MKHPLLATLVSSLALFAAAPGHAGNYSDELGRCLVGATSTKDKTNLVRWVFANAALHPQVASIASITAKERDALNRMAGALFERLLTDSCRKQSEDALRNEGELALQASFQVLGQVAMRELMTEPAVGKGFTDFTKYIDMKKLQALGQNNGK